MKRKIFLFFMTLVLFMSFSTVALAHGGGTVGSETRDGNTSSARWGDETAIGPRRCFGFKWMYWGDEDNPVNRKFNLKSTIYYANGRKAGSPKVEFEGFLAALLMKDVNKTRWKLYSWDIWKEEDLGSPANYYHWYPFGMWNHPDTPNGQSHYSIQEEYWKINRPLLVNIIERDGWRPNSRKEWYEHPDGRRLDAVWVSEGDIETEEPPEPEGESIEVLYSITSSQHGEIFKEKRNLDKIFENPKNELTYSFESGDGNHSYYNKLSVKTIKVNRESTYELVYKDGMNRWEFDGWKYWMTPGKTMEKEFYYTSIEPELQKTIFVPFNLNRNNHALEEDYVSQYGKSNGVKLQVSGDNMQGITDNSNIKMLDTNSAIPIKITIENDQLGIPTSSNGGWKLHQSIPSFSSAMKSGKSSAKTGVFKVGNKNYNVNGSVSSDLRWGGVAEGKLTGSNVISIKESGKNEVLGDKFSLSKTAGWRGGNFEVRNIKTGVYSFDSSKPGWWEIKYNQGKYWTYGVKYQGKITVSEIKDPHVIRDAGYKGLKQGVFRQPLVKAYFESKTVGGK